MKLLKYFTRRTLPLLLPALLFGCHTPPVTQPIKDMHITPLMKKRAAEMKQVMSRCSGFGVYLDEPSRVVYAKQPALLARRCKMLGITDIYLTVAVERHHNDPEYNSQLRQLARQLKMQQIRLWVILDNISLYTWADKLGRDNEGEITRESVKKLIGIGGNELAGNKLLAGILLVVKPQSIIPDNDTLPHTLLYSWGDDKYGIGNDNDIIMKYSFRIIRAVKRYAGNLKVILAIPHFIHEDKQQGRISIGGINQFLDLSERVIILDYASHFKTIRLQAENELKAAQRPHSVSICLKMDPDAINGNPYGDAINYTGWDRMLRGFKYLIRRGGKYPSFRGLVIYNYAGLERSWEFSDSKTADNQKAGNRYHKANTPGVKAMLKGLTR